MGLQRRHARRHFVAWQYQMETETACHFVILALLWVWSGRRTLTRAFDHAWRLSRVMFGWVAVTTYQGLTGALKK